MLLRLYTENKNRSKLIKLFKARFEAFSVYSTMGYWNGVSERSLVFEIIGSKKVYKKLQALAKEIKVINSQEAVLLQAIDNSSELI